MAVGGGGTSDTRSPGEGGSLGERSIRKARGRVQIRILGRKGKESVREPTHRLDRRGLKRS